MILDQKKTTIGYRCPECTGAVLSGVGTFALAGDLFRLKCPCGESEMTVELSSSGKVRLCVPCLFCPKPHHYTLSRENFFAGELIAFSCGVTGIDVAFIGNEEDVKSALGEQEETLKEIMEENGVSDIHVFRPDEDYEDPMVHDVVRFMLSELDEDKKIKCFCQEIGEIPLYDFQVLKGRARVFCEVCGAQTFIPLESVSDAQEFLNIDTLTLN